MNSSGPLAGVRILDLSVVGPASRCTRLLADYGAEVVKIGPVPGRGPAQSDPPFFTYGAGRGYQQVKIDVRDEDGRKAFLSLATTADVVVESFRPGVVSRLGIGYEDVSAQNPRIVLCSTSGYGQDGPRRDWAGHDIDYLAVSGYLAMSAQSAGGRPSLPGATIADAAAGGMQAALSIMAALFERQSTGKGKYLDVSVADGALWLMSLAVDENLATGAEPKPGHDVLSGRYACYGIYETADRRWVAVGAIEPKFFANLCRELGCEELAEHQYQDAHQNDIRDQLSEAFAQETQKTWIERLAGADTCVAPILEPAEVGDDEQLLFRGAFVDALHLKAGSLRQVGAVLAGMPKIEEPVLLPDPTATQTAELLEAAGVSEELVEDLLKRKVVA
jgi:alpha-methylacyl-CoA racemase